LKFAFFLLLAILLRDIIYFYYIYREERDESDPVVWGTYLGLTLFEAVLFVTTVLIGRFSNV